MENKYVGYILVGISLLMTIIIFMFQSVLTSFVDSSCTLAHGGNYCPMYDTIDKQTYLSLSIVGVLILVALIMIFSKHGEKVIIKTRTVEKKIRKKEIDTNSLTKEEKTVLNLIIQDKTIFQADLIEKTNFGKSKMTRILDRLEGNGLIERKRRGMTNFIVLKE